MIGEYDHATNSPLDSLGGALAVHWGHFFQCHDLQIAHLLLVKTGQSVNADLAIRAELHRVQQREVQWNGKAEASVYSRDVRPLASAGPIRDHQSYN